MIDGKNIRSLIVYMNLCLITWLFSSSCFAQCHNSRCIWNNLLLVESNSSLSTAQQLQQVVTLKKQFEAGRFPQDSVYARILHRIGLYQYLLNNNTANNDAITNTLLAAKINTLPIKGSCKSFAVNSYFNLGFYYESVEQIDKALNYYDSALQLAKKYPDPKSFGFRSRLKRVVLLSQKRDYQKVSEESTLGIVEVRKAGIDSLVLAFLNQRAYSFLFQNQLKQALSDADSAISYAKKLTNINELANALKTSALVYGRLGQFAKATSCFLLSINTRKKTGYFQQVTDDYIDFGNYYLEVLHNYKKAQNCYETALLYATREASLNKIANAETNTSALYFYKGMYKEALLHNTKALISLVGKGENILQNPTMEKLNAIQNKELVYTIFCNKTETLTWLYKKTKNKAYLNTALQAALLTDTLLTKMRHSQIGQQSKLYWRNHTKSFYSSALEACYLSNNTALAFYFMEKSRGILLTDALNELGASSHLPAAAAYEEEKLQINIVAQQQKLSLLSDTSIQYKQEQINLLQAKENFEHYTRSIEEKYPVYYQYKYATEVSSLPEMQKYLFFKNQSFIHYFVNDTVAYILVTTPGWVKFIKLSSRDFDSKDLTAYERFCASKQKLDNNYPAFARLSNKLYKSLFQPLKLKPGRVIICADDFLIPFEALCTDTAGHKFLLYNYAFSYVYSAGYILQKLKLQKASGNFLGIAPVSFASYNHLPDLMLSANALKSSAQYYTNSRLFLKETATRQNFFQSAPDFAVVTVFTHASADTSDIEPAIFMKDSVIHLSELLYFNKPATQLVILSACQTNVGKKETGEGIYSMARGFSGAGIPAVAATLWEADEKAIYSITEMFNQNLSLGMSKDEALQKAKIYFLKGGKQNLLPYYWANMIVAGNVEPVHLTTSNNIWLIIGLFALIPVAMAFALKRNSKFYSKVFFGKIND